MAQFWLVLKIIVQIFPAVVALVKAIEEAAPAAKLGGAKLELLQGIVADAYQTADTTVRKELPFEQLIQAVVSIANRIVGFFNVVGMFQKTA
jgi:hypothetical protein